MKKIAMFVVVALLSFSSMAQEKKSERKFYFIPAIGVGNAISHSAYSLFRGAPDEVKTSDAAFEFGINIGESSRLGLTWLVSGYYTDNRYKEDCSLHTFAVKIDNIYKVSNVWKLYYGALGGPSVAANHIDFGMADEDSSPDVFYRWGFTVQVEAGPQFSIGSVADFRVAFFSGVSVVKSAADADFAEDFNHVTDMELTDNTGIFRYGVRTSFTF